MDVDRRGGGLDGGQAVVVVDGVEQLDVQDAGDAGHGLAGEAHVRPPAVYSKASGQPSGPGTTFMRSGRSVCSSRTVPPTATASR